MTSLLHQREFKMASFVFSRTLLAHSHRGVASRYSAPLRSHFSTWRVGFGKGNAGPKLRRRPASTQARMETWEGSATTTKPSTWTGERTKLNHRKLSVVPHNLQPCTTSTRPGLPSCYAVLSHLLNSRRSDWSSFPRRSSSVWHRQSWLLWTGAVRGGRSYRQSNVRSA